MEWKDNEDSFPWVNYSSNIVNGPVYTNLLEKEVKCLSLPIGNNHYDITKHKKKLIP